MKTESVFEELLFTTVRIETKLSNGSISTGTSFIFEFLIENKMTLFLVTNKHVIKDGIEGTLLLHAQENDQPSLGKVVRVSIHNFEQQWFGHPEENIDVAIMPLMLILKRLEDQGTPVFIRAIAPSLIPSPEELAEDIDAVEDVVFIGYPNDIYDHHNLIPIVRKGTTATPPSIDFEGNPTFLVDASVFPGSSGSPVLLCNIGSYSPKGRGLKISSRIFFLGILASVFCRKDINTVEVIDIPTQKLQIVQTSQMIDLGIVYKSRVIIETIETFIDKISLNSAKL